MTTNPFLAFAKSTAERSAGMFAGSLSSFLIADGTDLWNTDWKHALGISGMAAFLSVLTSVTKMGVGPAGPGLTETVVVKGGPTG